MTSQRFTTEIKEEAVNDHRHEFWIASMCRVLRVTRGGFYQWLHKPVSDRVIEDQHLLGKIRESYVASGGVYGSLRVCGDLREAGEGCSKHRVAKIMRTHKIKALRGHSTPAHRRTSFDHCAESIATAIHR